MNISKKEQKTTTPLELIVFGGLVKVLTHRQTEPGASTTTVTRFPYSAMYLKQKLRTCLREKVKDSYGDWYPDVVEYPLLDAAPDSGSTTMAHWLMWRNDMWELSLQRSLEIWQVLPPNKIEASLGGLTAAARQSLYGKLGSRKRDYFVRHANGDWEFGKFKRINGKNFFKPLSGSAVRLCRARAKSLAKG